MLCQSAQVALTASASQVRSDLAQHQHNSDLKPATVRGSTSATVVPPSVMQ